SRRFGAPPPQHCVSASSTTPARLIALGVQLGLRLGFAGAWEEGAAAGAAGWADPSCFVAPPTGPDSPAGPPAGAAPPPDGAGATGAVAGGGVVSRTDPPCREPRIARLSEVSMKMTA